MRVWKPKTSYAATKDGDWPALLAEVAACGSHEAVDAFWTDYLLRRHRDNPETWSLALRDACEDRRNELDAIAASQAMDAIFSATVGAPGDLRSPRRTVDER